MSRNLTFTFMLTVAALSTTDALAMARKKMHVAELKGVTESQVNMNEGKASILVRGKAAELVFRMMKEEQKEVADSEALKLTAAKGATHHTIKGKQVSCSKIENPKKKQADYACAFDLKGDGTVWAANEAFNPSTFNLARTETGSKLFKKKPGRGLASATPTAAYSAGQAFLVYDEPGKQRNSENALIVFRGDSAREILGVLQNHSSTSSATWGDAKGRKGSDIACVGATTKEPERCAMVVTFRDGSVTRSGNPLFR
jgi:hypothetical protein